jgi:hypothetical protein
MQPPDGLAEKARLLGPVVEDLVGSTVAEIRRPQPHVHQHYFHCTPIPHGITAAVAAATIPRSA